MWLIVWKNRLKVCTGAQIFDLCFQFVVLGQAYYLSTYKTIKEFYYQTHSVFPVLFMDGVHRLAAVYTLNDTSAVVFYVWDSTTQTFAKSKFDCVFNYVVFHNSTSSI